MKTVQISETEFEWRNFFGEFSVGKVCFIHLRGNHFGSNQVGSRHDIVTSSASSASVKNFGPGKIVQG